MVSIAKTAPTGHHRATNPFAAVKAKIQRAGSLLTKENFNELFRRFFLAIGAVFKGIGTIAGAPWFGIALLIKKGTAQPNKYIVGSSRHALSQDELTRTLQKLEKSARKIKCLELVYPAECSIPWSDSSFKSLQNIFPEKLVVKPHLLPDDFLKSIESHTHFYQHDKAKQHYELKRKIVNLVLPQDSAEALRTVDELIEKGEKVTNLYLCSQTRYRGDLQQAIIRLSPRIIVQVLSPRDFSPEVLLPVLNLSTSNGSYY